MNKGAHSILLAEKFKAKNTVNNPNSHPVSLHGKRILLGVTGGIAAYKSAELARRMCEVGAEVRVVMTKNSEAFISSLTMQAVSGNAVRSETFDEEAEAGMSHIELARWADAIVVAPATAAFIARLTHGFADDLLTTLCLATESKIAIAPAMNRVMWSSPATQSNVNQLRERAITVMGPDSGDQACGEVGPGRMLQPEEIVRQVSELFSSEALGGLRVLVTAGSTWEAIDPVRGITNLSSGKMGYAIADAAAHAGADVTLVTGPATQPLPIRVATVTKVTSAKEMLKAVMTHLDGQDIFIAVAAVADYRPQTQAASKIKKQGEEILKMEFVRNPDILAKVKEKAPDLFSVGFAAETDNLISEARKKLLAKRADLIAANTVGGESDALGSDYNTLQLIDRTGVVSLGPALKTRIAVDLIQEISARFHARGTLQSTR